MVDRSEVMLAYPELGNRIIPGDLLSVGIIITGKFVVMICYLEEDLTVSDDSYEAFLQTAVAL